MHNFSIESQMYYWHNWSRFRSGLLLTVVDQGWPQTSPNNFLKAVRIGYSRHIFWWSIPLICSNLSHYVLSDMINRLTCVYWSHRHSEVIDFFSPLGQYTILSPGGTLTLLSYNSILYKMTILLISHFVVLFNAWNKIKWPSYIYILRTSLFFLHCTK